MPDLYVVNASPLIVLAKVGHLDLLIGLAQAVIVPDKVAEEVLAGPQIDPARLVLEAEWGQRESTLAIPSAIQALGLDPGETSVLTVALNHGNCVVVLDDGKARQAARQLGLTVIGTVGVVLRAKQQSLLPSAADVLRDLRAAGLYLNDTLLQAALSTVGEQWP